MCGIAGFVGFNDKKLIKKMTVSLKHRGPDESGYYSDSLCSLGNRRLSIIDLQTGKQPIHNETESIWITFNGEIFNFKPLKQKLEAKDHRFYTNSDTEVIVHAFEEFGENCVKHLNGQFAFALWDSENKKLFAARDRLGILPFYYSFDQKNKRFLFASEIKALLEFKGIKKTINNNALSIWQKKFFAEDLMQALPIALKKLVG